MEERRQSVRNGLHGQIEDRCEENQNLKKALCLPLFAHELVHLYSSTNLGLDRAIRQHEWLLAILQVGNNSLVSKVVRRMMRRFLRQDLMGVAAEHLSAEEAQPFGAEPPSVVQTVGTIENVNKQA